MTSITSRFTRRLLGERSWFGRVMAVGLAVSALVMGSAVPNASAVHDTTNAGHWDYCGDPFSGEHNRPGVYLYEHPNYTGKCSRLQFSVPNLQMTYVSWLASSMRVVVPYGWSTGLTLYPGWFYGPEPGPDYVAGSFSGASQAGFVRVYGFPDFNHLPVTRGGVLTTREISDDIKSIGIATGPVSGAANTAMAGVYSLPVFGPECPPVGRYCWISSTNPVVFGSPGANFVPNLNMLTGPVDMCSIWKVGCGPNPTGVEQAPPTGGGGDTGTVSCSDGRLIEGSILPGERGKLDLQFIPFSQLLNR
ncbi:MAG: hypothetical protein U0556_18190 [Dehalococcoidia bacterium]